MLQGLRDLSHGSGEFRAKTLFFNELLVSCY